MASSPFRRAKAKTQQGGRGWQAASAPARLLFFFPFSAGAAHRPAHPPPSPPILLLNHHHHSLFPQKNPPLSSLPLFSPPPSLSHNTFSSPCPTLFLLFTLTSFAHTPPLHTHTPPRPASFALDPTAEQAPPFLLLPAPTRMGGARGGGEESGAALSSSLSPKTLLTPTPLCLCYAFLQARYSFTLTYDRTHTLSLSLCKTLIPERANERRSWGGWGTGGERGARGGEASEQRGASSTRARHGHPHSRPRPRPQHKTSDPGALPRPLEPRALLFKRVS